MQKQKILLVAYQFCPKGGIGTRRWSKFAKYLSEKYEVHVIAAAYPEKDVINWCYDIENNPDIIVHHIAGGYPTWLHNPKRNLGIKITDVILRNTKFYFDYAQNWERYFIQKAITLIKEFNFINLLVTGPPFTPMIFAAKIKQQQPQIKLIVDYRDPWEYDLPFVYWNKKSRKKKYQALQQFVLEQADCAIFTTKALLNQYAVAYPKLASKFVEIYNGYDTNDFTNLEANNLSSLPFNMVYAGGITPGRAIAFIGLTKALHELDDPFLNDNLKINIYSHHSHNIAFNSKDLQETFDRNFVKRKAVSPSEVFKIINEHTYCISINAQHQPNVIGIKVFDYMALKKSIFQIGPPSAELNGILAEKAIVANYDTESLKQALLNLKSDFQKRQASELVEVSNSFEEFDIANLSSSLEKLLQKTV